MDNKARQLPPEIGFDTLVGGEEQRRQTTASASVVAAQLLESRIAYGFNIGS